MVIFSFFSKIERGVFEEFQMTGYKRDEALRITSVTFMLEGHTYTFGVRNTGGRFLLMMEKHEFPGGYFAESAKCCTSVQDPCSAESHDIKEAAWKSIEMHNKLAHYLRVIS